MMHCVFVIFWHLFYELCPDGILFDNPLLETEKKSEVTVTLVKCGCTICTAQEILFIYLLPNCSTINVVHNLRNLACLAGDSMMKSPTSCLHTAQYLDV